MGMPDVVCFEERAFAPGARVTEAQSLGLDPVHQDDADPGERVVHQLVVRMLNQITPYLLWILGGARRLRAGSTRLTPHRDHRSDHRLAVARAMTS
jgi:hypothetical protein